MCDFIMTMCDAGLCASDPIIPDGRLHRFHVEGDRPGSLNGWYFFDDNIAVGAFGSWRTGEKYTWCAKAAVNLTAAERQEYKRRTEIARREREVEEQARRKAAQDKALSIWKSSLPATNDHPYLIRKRVRSHGLRLYKDALVIPVQDSSGTLHSLQFIDGDGNKRFLSGGRKKGCYFAIGNPIDTLCIAEGYGTAVSIHEATGHAVAVAFDAGNLLSVAQILRAKFPEIEIILCADNDTETPGNPGLTKAREAAAACGALLAVPPIHGDFNDLYVGYAR